MSVLFAGLVGQPHDVEVADGQCGPWRRGADGGFEDGARAAWRRSRLPPPGGITLVEPAGDGGDGAALDLAERALVAGQVHEAGLPAIHRRRRTETGSLLQHPARRATADCVNTQYGAPSG